MFKRLSNKKGFTLVELLVVVIILAILAAVVIPQLRSSSQDAKLSALDSDLNTARSAIELYYHQHNSAYPGVIKQHKGAAHTSTEDAFAKQLTYCSDSAGNTTDTCDSTTYKFGPYVKKSIPKNPLPNSNTTDAQSAGVKVDSATATIGTAVADDTASKGWLFVQQTGEFFANNTTYASR